MRHRRRVGIDYLLSEDVQDGRPCGRPTLVIPFDAANAALFGRILPP